MSQRKNRLIKAFLAITGYKDTGKMWSIQVGMTEKGRPKYIDHILRDDKLIRKNYAAANAVEKYNLTREMQAIYVKLKLAV